MTVGWRPLLAQLGGRPSIVVTIFVAVLLAVLFLAATPRIFEQTSDEALRHTISDSSPPQKNIAVERATRISGTTLGNSPFGRVARAGDRFAEEQLSNSIRSVISDQTWMADTMQFGTGPLPGTEPGPFPVFVRFRYQDRIDQHSSLVEGALPGPSRVRTMLMGTECPSGNQESTSRPPTQTPVEASPVLDCEVVKLPSYEVAMTAETISVLNFGLGDSVILTPDPSDRLVQNVGHNQLDYQMVLTVSGEIELSDLDEEFWYGDPRLHRTSITENADLRIIHAIGLMNPDDYRALMDDLSPADWRYTWRYFVDSDLIEAEDADTLSAEIRNLQLGFSTVSSDSSGISVVTLLPTLIDGYIAQRALAISLMSMALAGVFAVSIALILEIAGLMSVSQRSALVLARNRGASRTQMSYTRFLQASVLTMPAALLGFFAAKWLVPESDYLVPYRTTVAFVVVTIATIVFVSIPLIFRRLGSLQRGDADVPRSSGTRLVLEGLIIVIAFGSVILLRRRGQIDAATTGGAEFDPLLAAAPALLGAAIGLLTLRVYPQAIRFASWLTSKGRDLVVFLGLKRILQQPSVARIPLVVILIAVSVAVFSSLVRTSIAAGQEESAWQAVGADFRVTGSGPGTVLPSAIDLSGVDGVEVTAVGTQEPFARVSADTALGFVDFLAIDSAAYQNVIGDTDGDPELPEFMFATPAPTAGTTNDPIPVIVSMKGWRPGRAPAVGERIVVDMGRLKPTVLVREVRDQFPGLPVDQPFVVADIRPLIELSRPLDVQDTVLYVRAGKGLSDELASTISGQASSARFTSRYETLSDVAEAPLVAAVDRGLAVTFVLSTLFAVVAAISSLALSSAARRRDFGYLRTLGLDTQQATGLTMLEQIPMLVVACGVGSLLGVGIVFVLQPSINLDAFTGGLISTTVQFDWLAVAAVSAILLVSLASAVVIFVLVNREKDLGRILKVGGE